MIFRLKDAMPFPKSVFLSKGGDGNFVYIRKFIKEQYNKSMVFCPGMREFVIIITMAGTVDMVELNEEW